MPRNVIEAIRPEGQIARPLLAPASGYIRQQLAHCCHVKGSKGAKERVLDPRDLDRLSGRARVRLGEEQTYQEMLPAVIRNYGQVKNAL